jgi:hypothetical protein
MPASAASDFRSAARQRPRAELLRLSINDAPVEPILQPSLSDDPVFLLHQRLEFVMKSLPTVHSAHAATNILLRSYSFKRLRQQECSRFESRLVGRSKTIGRDPRDGKSALAAGETLSEQNGSRERTEAIDSK